MHQFSFDSGDPFFDLDGWQVGLQVITFENVYGLDPELTRVEEDGGCGAAPAEGLAWGGGPRSPLRRPRPPVPPPRRSSPPRPGREATSTSARWTTACAASGSRPTPR